MHTLLFFLVPGDPRAELPERAEQKQEVWDAADFADPAIENENGNRPRAEDRALKWKLPAHRRFESLHLRLQFGKLNPMQWFTSPLLHDSLVQLLLNMVALWAFGFVVEGKIGWKNFAQLYFGIAFIQAALMQILLLPSAGGSFSGANAAVLGLLGIAMAWAPRNHLELWFGMYWGSREISILTYGVIQFAFSLLALGFGGHGLMFSLLPLMGMAMGMAVGVFWLKKGWVDCEGWDLMTILSAQPGFQQSSAEDIQVEVEARQLVGASLAAKRGSITTPSEAPRGNPGRHPKHSQAPSPEAAALEKTGSLKESAQRDIEELILGGNHPTALKMLAKFQHTGTEIHISQPALAQLIRGLVAGKQYAAAIAPIKEHIARFPSNRTSLQLNLAKILLHLERPQKAIATLKSIDKRHLDEQALATWKQLAAHAKDQIDDGVIELSDDSV